jgi:hypothetical protein
MRITKNDLTSMVEQINEAGGRLLLCRDDYGYCIRNAGGSVMKLIAIGGDYYTRLSQREMFFFLAGCLAGKSGHCESHF